MSDLMLAHVPTPMERADRLAAELGMRSGQLWIKREDCTGLATGGNKARKLQLLVAEALATGCDVLVTGGGPQSNHARLTAAAAARAGVDCVLAFNSDPPLRAEGNQILDILFGAERRFVGRLPLDSLNEAIAGISDLLRQDARRPYVVPVGGSSPLGASAYASAAEEIRSDLGHDDVLVVTATASGGTQAGLAARLGHARVLGVDTGAFVDPGSAVSRLAIEVAELLVLAAPTGEPQIVRDQIGDGYGAPTAACLDAIRLAARTEGLLLDPVYSGKAMAGLVALARSELPPAAVVFLATGGIPTLFDSRYGAWLSAEGGTTAIEMGERQLAVSE